MLLRGFTRFRDFDKAKIVIDVMQKEMKSSTQVHNHILHSYLEMGRTTEARSLFEVLT